MALCSPEEAKTLHRSRLRSMHFFALDESHQSSCFFNPLPLTDIYRFTNKMHKTLRHHDKEIVACARKHDSKTITNTALLLGSFLILGKNVDYDD